MPGKLRHKGSILNDAPISESPSTTCDKNEHISVKEEFKYDSALLETSESDMKTFKNGSNSEQVDSLDWENQDLEKDRRCGATKPWVGEAAFSARIADHFWVIYDSDIDLYW
ncbi:hypothetical protein MAM1_0228c08396 [Mucor ambiguus]|uniref:Uncharacterized protein n=1 Tax=Mucor ambiguus TaxID=91626 RepID=A0A0C9N2Q8_9FUNG|nr:hypothetical protein MAM1_0228c08396 [Mucor ambiguus]